MLTFIQDDYERDDNYEDDDEDIGHTQSTRASDSVLASRKFVKAKRVSGSEQVRSSSNIFANLKSNPVVNNNTNVFANLKAPPVKTGASMSSQKSIQNKSKSEFQNKMQKLNHSFLSWIERQLDDHPVSNWAEGLSDYLKHSKKIVDEFAPAEDSDEDEEAILSDDRRMSSQSNSRMSISSVSSPVSSQ